MRDAVATACQRRDPLRPAIGNDPGEAAAPIMADQVEPPAAVADARDDVVGIADQFVDPVFIETGRVRTRTGGVAALVGGHGKIPAAASTGIWLSQK